MKQAAPAPFGVRLKALREAAGFTQEELASIAGVSVHAVSSLERGQRKRPHPDTIRALSAALDLTGPSRDELIGSARPPVRDECGDDELRRQLPIPPTTLVGRDGEVRTLCAWLAIPNVRLVTLTGPGGVGKTRLALEVARTISADAGARVVFVPLAAMHDPALVASAIAEALGLADVTPVDLTSRARLACENRQLLLVLDNLEQVPDAAPLIADLLQAVGGLRLLATSRSPLHVRGEREFVLGPLPLEDSAVRLFVERARDARPAFRLTPENEPTVKSICQRLDALPLALELAAPWLRVLTPVELLRRLSDDVLLASVGPRDLPERQQTINATVAWSYHLLAPREQRAFRRLGVLPARFSIDAAAAVLAKDDDALALTAVLINKSLLLRVESSLSSRPMYQMLETVRAYAGQALASAGEREEALDGLARYCLGESALAADGLAGVDQVEWLGRVRDDLENYRAALHSLIEQQRAVEAGQIAWSLLFYFLIRGHAAEGLDWYERLGRSPGLPSTTETRMLIGASVMLLSQGAIARAREAADRAILLARAAGETALVVQAEHLAGHLARGLGRIDEAKATLLRCADAFKQLNMPWGAGSALNGLAGLALHSGDDRETERLLDEATVLLRQAGPWFQMQVLFLRAIHALRRGNADAAIAFVRENLQRIRELHDRFAFVYALIPLASAAALKGDDEWAARILGARDALDERTGARVDPTVRDLREAAERAVRARLTPELWDRAYGVGQRASIDSAHDLYRFVFSGRS